MIKYLSKQWAKRSIGSWNNNCQAIIDIFLRETFSQGWNHAALLARLSLVGEQVKVILSQYNKGAI